MRRTGSSSINPLLIRQLGRRESGYSLPLVLVIALVLIAGAATLVARSGSTAFGSIFQKQSWEARSLAEFGMATLVGRLNREENRYLLAAPPEDLAPGYARDQRWTTNEADLKKFHANPCADEYTIDVATGLKLRTIKTPSIQDIYPNTNPEGWWYINASGQISTSNAGAVGRFKLRTTQGSFLMAARKQGSEIIDFSRPDGKSSIKLTIEAETLNSNGSLKSKAILEEVLDVVPKCCKTTFGDDHGSNSYKTVYSGSNALGAGTCVPPLNPDSFGIVYGINGNGGKFKINGNTTSVERLTADYATDSTGDYITETVSPLACLENGSIKCVIDGTYNGIDPALKPVLEVLNTTLPKAPSYYPGCSIPGGSTGSCLPTSYTTLPTCTRTGASACPVVPLADARKPTNKNFIYRISTPDGRLSDEIFINGNADPLSSTNPFGYPPAQCIRTDQPPLGDGALHCIISRLGGSGGSIPKYQFVTTTEDEFGIITKKPIRLYFPLSSSSSSDKIVVSGGSNAFQHCSKPIPNLGSDVASIVNCRGDSLVSNYKSSITQLSLFGCNTGINYYKTSNTADLCTAPNTATGGGSLNPPFGQIIDLQGDSSSMGFFMYFPSGNVVANGNVTFEGVLWTANIIPSGNIKFFVPASGVNDAFELMGINPGPTNDCRGSLSGTCNEEWLPKWDFIARSARRVSYR